MKRLSNTSARRGVRYAASVSGQTGSSGSGSLLGIPSVFRPSARSQDNLMSINTDIPFPVADRRFFQPSTVPNRHVARATRSPRLLSGLPARLVAPSRTKPRGGRSKAFSASIPAILAFASRSTSICVRRGARREVLFAKGVPGSRVRRPKRNFHSNVRC